MRGKKLIYLILFVLLVGTVSALSDIDVEVIDNRVEFGEIATYEVTITNQGSTVQVYSFFTTSGVDWSLKTAPSPNQKLTLLKNNTGTMDIEVQPLERFTPGIYLVPLKIESDRGESYTENLEVYIGPSVPQQYQQILTIVVDVDEIINPTETQSIKVFVHNQNPRNYPELTLKIQSDLSEFEREQDFELRPSERKTIEFAIEPNPFTQPKDYYLFFTIEQNGEVIKTFDKKIEIKSLTPDFTQTVSETSSFLKTSRLITLTNDGNIRNQQTVKIRMGALTDLFTSTDPDAYVLKDEQGRRHIAWDFELGINEEVSVTVTTSYRIPVILLLALIIFVILYFIYKSPIHVTKAASNVIMHEGGVSALKITLVIKNIGSKPIKNVEVFDTAPSIASIEKDVEIGTLKPTEILRHRSGGILLKWKISELEGHEERLITYKIKSKLNIVGTISLPRAKIKYNVGKSQRTAYSNMYRVGGSAEE